MLCRLVWTKQEAFNQKIKKYQMSSYSRDQTGTRDGWMESMIAAGGLKVEKQTQT